MSEVMQKDLVLAPNEYAFVLDETKGNVSCNVGPHKMSLSQSDRPVRFDNATKKFVPCDRYKDAIQLFVIAPEGWYVALKNPAPGNSHPKPGVSNTIPDNMKTGCKVMIPGPINFALYPGQMAEVIQGHYLRSNQYLVAKVYDADTLNSTKEERGAAEEGSGYLHKFSENGMYISDMEILNLVIESNIQALIDKHQERSISRALELTAAESSAAVETRIAILNKDRVQMQEEFAQFKADQAAITRMKELELEAAEKKAKDEEKTRCAQAEKELIDLQNIIAEAKLEADRKQQEMELEFKQKHLELEAEREAKSAAAMKELMTAIGPDPAAAMNTESNQEILTAIASAIAPYAVANGGSVSDAINTILRGTSMEKLVSKTLG